MIELRVEKYCNDCPNFVPECESDTATYRDDMNFVPTTVYLATHIITCKKKDECAAMMRYLKEKSK